MSVLKKLRAIPNGQKYRYGLIILSCSLFFAPFLFLPGLVGNPDLCGRVCIRRFYLYFPGMTLDDLGVQMSVAWIGVIALAAILVTTFFFGRMWCAYICPVGGFPELVSRLLNDRWKIEYRALPQVPIRYGYFAVYLVLMPTLGISACTLCNFITVPRIFEAFSGGLMGIAFLFSAVGIVNLGLLFLLGFFASKGRAYCQFLCPIGAIDGLVNRLGARFRFTRRIRVERERCTGCNVCARQCMTGAIKMVDRIAVVDQLSCMSCHECVDVCDWHAIDWLSAPPANTPKRKKKGVDYHPLPQWTALHRQEKPVPAWRRIDWQRLTLALIVSIAALFVVVTQVVADERRADPDGCLVCHALPGLEYVDEQGLLRVASIDTPHYLSSLHGSVPCRDCHRKIRDYPHKPENGAVDCAASCHVEEPSGGKPYTHKTVTEEFRKSVHGKGKSKGFTGANRLQEADKAALPSCRKCHANELYIGEEELPRFREDFAHLETECGRCHRGKVWMNRFGGHILRRFIGSRWDKNDHNRLCNDCHADHRRMSRVEIENPETGNKEKAGARFVLASDSYAMTLHGRLLRSGVEAGASCIDCHAPSGFRHGVRRHDDPLSSTHKDNLARTCASEGCHGFATHPLNAGFVQTDLHDIDMIVATSRVAPLDGSRLSSNWSKAIIAMLPILLVLGGGSLLWLLFGDRRQGVTFAVLGGNSFQKRVIGRKPKKHRRRHKKHGYSGKGRRSS